MLDTCRAVLAALRRVAGLLRPARPEPHRAASGKRTAGKRVVAGTVAVAALGALVTGIGKTDVDTDASSFLPTGDPALRAIEDNSRSFGSDPIVVLLKSKKPRQLFGDQRQLFQLLGLEGKLAGLSDTAAVYGPATMVNQIAAATQNLLAEVSGRRAGLRQQAEELAKEQGKSAAGIEAAGNDAVSRFDARYGRLVVQGLPAGMPTVHNLNFVRSVIFDSATNQPRPRWRFVVPTMDSVALVVRPREGLDQDGTQALVSRVRSAVTGSGLTLSDVKISGVPVVMTGLSREVWSELPLLGSLIALAVALRFLLVPQGVRMRYRLWPLASAALGTAATLAIFGLLSIPLSLAAVALLPILLGVGSSIPLYLAVLTNTRSVVVMSLASAAGFASLAVSPLPFVRELGLALAAGIMLTVAAALVFRWLFPLGFRPPVRSESIDLPNIAPRRIRLGVTALAAVLAGIGWFCLPHLDVQANPQQMARGLPELETAAQAQDVLGSSGEVGIVLKSSKGNVLNAEAFRWADNTEKTIVARYGDQLRPILTMPDLLKFLGREPTDAQVGAAVRVLPQYLTSAVVSPDSKKGMLIFGIRLQDLGAQARVLDEVRKALPNPPHGYRAELVGLPVAADRGYELISDGRYLANVAGIVAAGAVLLIGLRRRSDAWRAVAAAVLSTGWSLAGIWLLGGELNPLTVALGSLTTVTGCEFTILLANTGVRRSRWLRRSVAFACLTSTIGYFVLVASGLEAMREFGLILTGTVLLSYVAARVVVWLAPPRQVDDSSEAHGISQSGAARTSESRPC